MIVCGTGHRPDKLGGYGEEVKYRLQVVAENWLAEQRPSRVISGGALGWDQALANAAFVVGIPCDMYLPFMGFESKWPRQSQADLHAILRDASQIKYISEEGYAPYKMQVRNEAMVNDSALVLALWNGTPGGTANCIKYASKINKPIENLWDKYSEKENT